MSPQDMANCAYGLSIMSFDIENPSDVSFRGAHESLISMIKSSGRVLLPTITTHNHDDGSSTGRSRNVGDNTSDDDYIDGVLDTNATTTTTSTETLLNSNRSSSSSSSSSSSTSSIDQRRWKKSAQLLSREEIEQLRIFAHYVKVLLTRKCWCLYYLFMTTLIMMIIAMIIAMMTACHHDDKDDDADNIYMYIYNCLPVSLTHVSLIFDNYS